MNTLFILYFSGKCYEILKKVCEINIKDIRLWRKIKQLTKNTEMPYYKTTLNGKYSIAIKTEDPKEGEKVLSEEFKFKEMHFETKEISKEMYKYLTV